MIGLLIEPKWNVNAGVFDARWEIIPTFNRTKVECK